MKILTQFFPPLYRPRHVPGPGAGNIAFIPQTEDPLFSPTGTGIVTSYPWQLTARGDYFLKRYIYAGEVQGVQTGAFGIGQPLQAMDPGSVPTIGNAPGAVNLAGATG